MSFQFPVFYLSSSPPPSRLLRLSFIFFSPISLPPSFSFSFLSSSPLSSPLFYPPPPSPVSLFLSSSFPLIILPYFLPLLSSLIPLSLSPIYGSFMTQHLLMSGWGLFVSLSLSPFLSYIMFHLLYFRTFLFLIYLSYYGLVLLVCCYVYYHCFAFIAFWRDESPWPSFVEGIDR